MIKKEDYKSCLRYIDKYWDKTQCHVHKDMQDIVGLPHSFYSPNDEKFKNLQFYWDTYFMIISLVESKRLKQAIGMVENLAFLQEKYNVIPSMNKIYAVTRSQPPFLTSMILKIYTKTQDKMWLRKMVKVAEKEYDEYWMKNHLKTKTDKRLDKRHSIYKGLSRYCDQIYTLLVDEAHARAEHESGWDMTSRFNDQCLFFLPIDLNSCLYKYEKDFAYVYKVLKNPSKQKLYSARASKRKKMMWELMWNEKKGFFFDYDHHHKKQSTFYSMAGFFPLWAGLASEEQAVAIKKNLKKFECKGGLATTQKTKLLKKYRQWDYPNGWPNLHWITIRGLVRYGFHNDAERIAKKWLDTNQKVFLKSGKFCEKYDVVKAAEGKSGRYPSQYGFGWTNAVFERLVKEFSE